MPALTDEQKTFIVLHLACFDTPQQVADAVKETYGVEVPRNQVQQYDARRTGKKPAPKWIQLYEATRKRFLDEVGEIPIANKSVRLRRLERIAHQAEHMGNYPLAAQLLEQAAKEVGNAYTNRRELTGAGGGPIQTDDVGLTDEQRAARVLALLERARERKEAAS